MNQRAPTNDVQADLIAAAVRAIGFAREDLGPIVSHLEDTEFRVCQLGSGKAAVYMVGFDLPTATGLELVVIAFQKIRDNFIPIGGFASYELFLQQLPKEAEVLRETTVNV